jgi:hypothetical protein
MKPSIGTVKRVVVAAIVGGTLSEITGGKFANGAASWAVSAAMAQDTREPQKRGIDPKAEGAVLPEVAKAAIARAESGLVELRKRRYTDMDALAMDTADVLQPIQDAFHTEVGARIFKNGKYFELGAVVSSGKICLPGKRCSVPIIESSSTDDTAICGNCASTWCHAL